MVISKIKVEAVFLPGSSVCRDAHSAGRPLFRFRGDPMDADGLPNVYQGAFPLSRFARIFPISVNLQNHALEVMTLRKIENYGMIPGLKPFFQKNNPPSQPLNRLGK
jgi:hypothetical protein